MKTSSITILTLAAALLVGCSSTGFLEDERRIVNERMESSGARVVNESIQRTNGQSRELVTTYEFDADLPMALAKVRGVCSQYQTMKQTADELDFVRADGGDSVYVNALFTSISPKLTRVKLSIRSMPS